MRALILIFLLAFVCAGCRASSTDVQPASVLFVGNSLTYVGNLPAVFSALASSNGKPIQTDMIVRGGATLHQRVDDGSVALALSSKRYTAIVLQERGGDLMGLFGRDAEAQSRKAIEDLARLGLEQGVKVVLLGSYQPHPWASKQLVRGESAAAEAAGVPYIAISEALQELRVAEPEFIWLAPDQSHPGKDLTLLNAVLLHRALFGSLPSPSALTVKAPIYGSTSGLKETLRSSDAAPPLADTPLQIYYPSETLQKLIATVGGASGS